MSNFLYISYAIPQAIKIPKYIYPVEDSLPISILNQITLLELAPKSLANHVL